MSFQIKQVNTHPLQLLTQNKAKVKQQNSSFKGLLESIPKPELKISKHAEARLNEREIHISNEDWISINEKVKEARQKGVTDSLILIKNAALIVSTKNNTVVTAMDINDAKSQIFTNINGTIIMD